MYPDFDRGLSPSAPLTARAAVERAHDLITQPVIVIMIVVAAGGFCSLFLLNSPIVGMLLLGSTPFVAWIWWSFATPRWRYWAIQRGVNPDELQRLGEQEKVVWPVGHPCGRTEFPLPRSWRK